MRGFPAQIGLNCGTPAAPATPALSITASGTSAVATITGEAGATHYLKYKGSSHSAWQDGGSRSGDGIITVENLSLDVPYIFIAYSRIASGPWSLPAVACLVTLAAIADNKFDQQIVDDADIFLDAFAETICYLPSGGGSRTIRAIVDREGARGLDGMPYGNAPVKAITVANNSTTGISAAEFDGTKDKASIPEHKGEQAKPRILTKIIGEDAGMITIEVR